MQNNSEKGSLSETFDSFGSAPKAGAWEDIAAALDEPKRNRKAIIWWWSSGLAATLVIGFVSFYYFSGTTKQDQNKDVSALKSSGKNEAPKQQTTSEKQSPEWSDIPQNHADVDHPIINNGERLSPEWQPEKKKSFPENSSMNDIISKVVTAKLPLEKIFGDAFETTVSKIEKTPSAEEDKLVVRDNDDSIKGILESTSMVCIRISYPKWRFGIHGDFAWNNTETGPVTKTDPTLPNSSADFYSYPNYNPTPFMRKNVGVQLTVGRNLWKKHPLWLESGFQYNRFISDRHADLGNEQQGYLIHQSVGIPLNLSYRLFYLRKWDFYVSTGILNQFVYKSTQNILVKNSINALVVEEEPPNPTNYNERFHLISGTVGLDITYRVRVRWELTVQPQFRYYLGSATNSPWSDTFQRSWFGGTIGVRYKLFR